MKVIFDKANSGDIFYRCGFNSDDECLYVERGKSRTLYVFGFEYDRAVKEAKVKVKKVKDLKKLLKSFKGTVEIPPRFPFSLSKLLKKKKIVYEMFPERKIKTAKEIKAISDSQKAAKKAIEVVQKILNKASKRNGNFFYKGKKLTCEYLKFEARKDLINRGYDCAEIVLSTGGQTSQPHNRGTGPIKEGPVVIDCFPQSEKTKFHGDMTRTFIVGKDEKSEKMLRAVKKVHNECLKMYVPGAVTADIHNYAIKRLEELGYKSSESEGMNHALGHGVGLEVHESPIIAPRDKTVLKKGMVLALEPGLYYKKGVRWENVVLVGKKPRIL